jgi:hypothetical protein
MPPNDGYTRAMRDGSGSNASVETTSAPHGGTPPRGPSRPTSEAGGPFPLASASLLRPAARVFQLATVLVDR